MKSLSSQLKYIVEAMPYDYVDYKVDIQNPTPTTIHYGRCYKKPSNSYGVIDVQDILRTYCNMNEIFLNETYLTGGINHYIYPVLKFNISVKQPNSQLYILLVESEEVLYSNHNHYYNYIPTQNLVPNVLQHKRVYNVLAGAPIAYDCVRKYFDTNTSASVYYRPNGNNALIYSNALTKSNLNHFVYNDYHSINPTYVEIWTVIRYYVGPTLTEFVVPDSLIRYNYTGYCYDTEYVVYWINRYGGLESRIVDGKVSKNAVKTSINYITNEIDVINGQSISKNRIGFTNKKKGTVKYQYGLNFINDINDVEIEWLETLFASNYVWLYNNSEFIPVVVSDDNYNYNYYKLNTKSLPTIKINVEE